MRSEVRGSSRRFTATKVSIGRNAVIIYTDDERFDIPIPDGIYEGLELPPQGTQLRNVQVSTNSGGDVLYGFYPAKGTHIVQFWKFSSKGDEEPTPRVLPGGPRTRKDGGKFMADDRLIFTALLKILYGDFAGCVVPYMQDYLFEKDTDGTCYLKGSTKKVAQVENFLTLCGMDVANETLRYKDNILPDLQQLLSEMADENIFQLTMQDGWVDEISELPAGFNPKMLAKAAPDDEDDVRPEVPAKKVLRPAASTVRVIGSDADDDEFDDDEDFEKPAKLPRTGKKRDVWPSD